MRMQFLRMTVLLILALVAGGGRAFAQETIVGRVTDTDNNPLVGVTVLLKGTTTGTATDAKGNYAIKVSGASAVLDFSYLGYMSQSESIGKRTVVNVQMKDEATAIGNVEIVSVGYGSVARRDLTGSVAKADMTDILKSNVTSFDQALSGRIAGVVVTTNDGALGSEANITIRGGNSLTQSNAPLYVIDGFPMESSLATVMNPNDIESIDVLKDASATAIYGARGANGVIVITTKKGTEGRPTVTFNAGFTVDQIANKADLMGPYEFVKLQSEITTPSSMAEGYFKERTLEDYRRIPGYDWQDDVYRTSFTQKYDISLRGGSAGTKYNISFSAVDQDGIIVNSNFQRYQGRVNFTQDITKKLQFTLNANYARAVTSGVSPSVNTNSTSSATGWLIYSIWGYRPVTPVGVDISDSLLDEDLSGSNDYRFNPAKTVRNEYRKNIVDNVSTNAALTYAITPNLKLRVSGNYGFDRRRAEAFNGSNTYSGFAGSPGSMGVNGSIRLDDYTNWANENTLTWKKRFLVNHNIELLGGVTFQGSSRKTDGLSSRNIAQEELGIGGLSTGECQILPTAYDDWRMMSYLFRLNYNFKYKYYLTASFRADGSSKFPTDNRWGYFPSVGGSWNFNRENLFKDQKWLTNGKLRASWGMTGNNRTQTSYDFYKQITVSPGSGKSVDYTFDDLRVPGSYVSNPGNPKLKWETTTQTNVGVDLGFLDDRIKLTADWYLKDTRDLLLFSLVAPSSGYQQSMLNIGSIRNQGFEFSFETVNVKTRTFQWRSNFNISLNRNTVTHLFDKQNSLTTALTWDGTFNSQFPYIAQVGRPAGLMYGLIYEGTYKNEDFDQNGVLRSDVPYLGTYSREAIRPGDLKYRDMNHDGIISEDDRTIIGSGQPLHTGGFGNTFTWKNFDLNIFLSWSYGNDLINANRYIFESGRRAGTNQLSSYANRWSPENPHSNIPRSGAQGEDHYSSRMIEDGSFLRLRNISLGYTVPARVLSKARIGSLRVYVSADNIYTFTGYSGPDPEVSTRNSVLTPGFDWSAYPRTMGITAGVNVSF